MYVGSSQAPAKKKLKISSPPCFCMSICVCMSNSHIKQEIEDFFMCVLCFRMYMEDVKHNDNL